MVHTHLTSSRVGLQCICKYARCRLYILYPELSLVVCWSTHFHFDEGYAMAVMLSRRRRIRQYFNSPSHYLIKIMVIAESTHCCWASLGQPLRMERKVKGTLKQRKQTRSNTAGGASSSGELSFSVILLRSSFFTEEFLFHLETIQDESRCQCRD